MVFRPSENLAEQLTRIISDKIIYNQLAPGERIMESRLAEEMGISRSPVREALRILEKQKLVELIPRKGARVTQISSAHIKWFYDIFEVLYGLVARGIAENAGEETFNRLKEILKKLEKAATEKNTEAYFDGIFEFAATGLRASGNPLLEAILLDLWPYNQRIQYASLSSRDKTLKNNLHFFQEMHATLVAGNAEELVETVRAYVRNEKRYALEMINVSVHSNMALNSS